MSRIPQGISSTTEKTEAADSPTGTLPSDVDPTTSRDGPQKDAHGETVAEKFGIDESNLYHGRSKD